MFSIWNFEPSIWTGLLTNLTCLAGALALWSRAKPRGVSVVLGMGILTSVQALLVILITGWLNIMYPASVVALSAMLSLGLIITNYRSLTELIRTTLADLQIVRRRAHFSIWASLAATLAVVTAFWVGWLGTILPATDYDGQAYHIPIGAFHLQAANLARINTPYRGILAYPANGSLFISWSWLTAGSTTWFDLIQWPFWVMGTLAIYKLVRLLGSDRTSALLGALVFAAAPIVVLQARSAQVDVMLTGLLITAVALLYDETLALPSRTLIIGCALGLAVGIKDAGAIYSVLIGGLAIVWWLRDRPLSFGRLIGYLALLGLPMMLFGSFWYFADWRDLGNPVWPIQVQVGQHILFHGVWTIETFYETALPPELAGLNYPRLLLTVWREATSVFTPDMRLGGLGPLWLVTGLPALVVMAVNGLWRRKWTEVVLVLLAAGVFFLTPENWYSRYVLLPLALSAAAVGWLLGQLKAWPQRLLRIGVIGAAAYSVALTLAFGPITPTLASEYSHLPLSERSAVFSGIVPASDDAMRWFNQNVPADATVAYSWGSVVLFPFWNDMGQRELVYVPPTQDGQWWAALLENRVQYLIAYTDSDESLAAARDPHFQPLFQDAHYVIYFVHA